MPASHVSSGRSRPSELGLWASSGAMALTGFLDGPPMAAPGAPASSVANSLATLQRLHPEADLPDVGLLGERAAAARLRRRAPWSAGGSFRVLETLDGSFGLSLPRSWDIEALPALVEAPVHDPWSAVSGWAKELPTQDVVDRARLLGLACAPVTPPSHEPRRDPLLRRRVGPHTRGRERPLVVDLSSLWAGPLCTRLLAVCGARVVKAESISRPDGARSGPSPFFDLMHAGHEAVSFDPTTAAGQAALARLIDQADVVIEASRPRALERLGIDAAHHVDAGKVWVSITAYGRDSGAIGFGDDVAAGAGLLRDGHIPCGDALADPLTGCVAAAAAASSLHDGRGALLDVSMHHVARSAAGAVAEHAVTRRRGGWWAEDDTGAYEILPPGIRVPTANAPAIGADNDRWGFG